MNPSQIVRSGEPEIPTEIANRKPRALTQMAAEQGAGVLDDFDVVQAPKRESRKAKTAKEAFVTASGNVPLSGLTAKEVDEIRGRSYTNAPKMDRVLGDKTQSFVNWLWKNVPKDAIVRYAYRDVFPTE